MAKAAAVDLDFILLSMPQLLAPTKEPQPAFEALLRDGNRNALGDLEVRAAGGHRKGWQIHARVHHRSHR
jgi:hypothetical protein